MTADPAVSPPGSTTSLDPLRLVVCPACGYSLEGLPPEGVCPECGGRYDQSAIILHGYARGGHASLLNAPPWLIWAFLIVPLYWIFHGWLMSRRATHLGILVSIMNGLVLVWLLWRRWNTPTPGLVLVRLDGEGCSQNDAPARRASAPSTPWASIHEVLLEPARAGRYRLRLGAPVRWWQLESPPVDAEVAMTPKQAEVLRQWIDTCTRRAS